MQYLYFLFSKNQSVIKDQQSKIPKINLLPISEFVFQPEGFKEKHNHHIVLNKYSMGIPNVHKLPCLHLKLLLRLWGDYVQHL